MHKNTRLLLVCVVVFVGMVGAAYAAVPLYRLFCQKTGFGGTPKRAEAASGKVVDQSIVVRFDTNTRDVPWRFEAEQTSQVTKFGATGLAFFKVTNNSDKPVTGRAAYNVVPESVSPYFSKLECFCFTDQTLEPGETKEFPVAYFIDPLILKDKDARQAQEVTLSYTFYRSANPQPPAAAKPAPKG
jgi:cytochrome c oxidase assembly protein subunit 11